MDAASVIREARRKAGLSQRELAARADTSGPAISMYESGERIPRVDTLQRIIEATGATFDVALESGGADHPLDDARNAETLEQLLDLADLLPRKRDRELDAPILGWFDR